MSNVQSASVTYTCEKEQYSRAPSILDSRFGAKMTRGPQCIVGPSTNPWIYLMLLPSPPTISWKQQLGRFSDPWSDPEREKGLEGAHGGGTHVLSVVGESRLSISLPRVHRLSFIVSFLVHRCASILVLIVSQCASFVKYYYTSFCPNRYSLLARPCPVTLTERFSVNISTVHTRRAQNI